MIGKHFLCRDPKCKICSERMADKIIKEEAVKKYTRADMIRAFTYGVSNTFNLAEHRKFFKWLAEKERELGIREEE